MEKEMELEEESNSVLKDKNKKLENVNIPAPTERKIPFLSKIENTPPINPKKVTKIL